MKHIAVSKEHLTAHFTRYTREEWRNALRAGAVGWWHLSVPCADEERALRYAALFCARVLASPRHVGWDGSRITFAWDEDRACERHTRRIRQAVLLDNPPDHEDREGIRGLPLFAEDIADVQLDTEYQYEVTP